MFINHDNSRIGDTVLIEPALTAWAIRNRERVPLYTSHYRELFEGHPHIRLVDSPIESEDIRSFGLSPTLSPSAAFDWSTQRDIPFAAGYFHQLGMEVNDGDRLHYKMFGLGADNIVYEPAVYIAPFARSCAGHGGGKPNLQAPLDWWAPIINEINAWRLRVYSLGDDIDPPVPGTIPWRGFGLRGVVQRLAGCRLLISVETGILHLASAAKCPTIFLSSATPVSLCRPDTACKVVRAASPLEWKTDDVIRAMRRILFGPTG